MLFSRPVKATISMITSTIVSRVSLIIKSNQLEKKALTKKNKAMTMTTTTALMGEFAPVNWRGD